ncbi:MAG: 23S rRNA (pseudouridine(1915)-N(3))-methyltransferase RlmH [bacterium]|jgi:23S rRNA (pseudouridine1915-N3)-methyltransferase|nr:23S rRNA (pseudouridine(1915)-N(3))-methyltransferase RlmH [bacterium]
MKIKIIVVGRTKEKFLQIGEKEFQQRLARYCQVEWITVKEEKIVTGKSDHQIKANEAERILEKIAPKSWKVALDTTGKPMSSEGLAAWLQKKMNEGTSEFEFIIGGALGLDSTVLNSVNQVLSLSQMTFTHEMSRLILLEQLYRAFTILRGEKYHK